MTAEDIVLVATLVGTLCVPLIVWILWRSSKGAPASALVRPDVACPSCGHCGQPRFYDPGSTIVGVLLLLLALVPGLIYAVWRSSAQKWVCAACGQPGVVPVNTPRGADLARQYGRAAERAG